MRTIVCGGRDYANREHVYAVLDRWKQECDYGALVIIQGGATGADALARDWCASRKVEYANVPADWKAHGKAAGPMRNAKMISDYDPKCVIAFPGGRGTADMVMKAQDAKLFVRVAIP